ncbi:hypothetical protein [Arthrobacter sp. ISL-30]|uniref:hypothetical protein n=1 Tax=Arthrobacter sp. ISL-30 TaxID=2819109 RepID=UPI001BE5B7CD|nr:hypothetical protein [Arthrobacter sp. ISL-30]MBT2515255.1 hypothetical protein [Arthrobacter sp. ISL-30]
MARTFRLPAQRSDLDFHPTPAQPAVARRLKRQALLAATVSIRRRTLTAAVPAKAGVDGG